MKVLITNINIDYFKSLEPTVKIEPSTRNTSIMTCTPKKFEKIRAAIRESGNNPYALMSW